MQTSLYTEADTLVTGATGLIGRWLVPTLTQRGRVVAVAMRSPQTRADAYLDWVAARGGDPARVTFVPHELDDPAPLDWRLPAVRDVYHLAAVFRWHLPLDQARRANVEGALRVLDWSAQQPALRRFVQVSGYRVAIPDASPLAGGYEQSKREAHLAIIARASQRKIPLTVLNPASVIGDSQTGATTQLLGLGELMGKLAQGKLPVAPGDRATFVPLVPVDVVAQIAAALVEHDDTVGQHYWLLDEDTPTLPVLLDQAATHLGVRPPRLYAPVHLLKYLPEVLLGSPRETLEFIAPDRYDASAARALARRLGVQWPAIGEVWPRWLDHLARAGFDAARLEPAS